MFNQLNDQIKTLTEELAEKQEARTVYITFETHQQSKRSLSLLRDSSLFVDDHSFLSELKFKTSIHPSSIIWENRNIDEAHKQKSVCFVLSMLCLVILASFTAIQITKLWVFRAKNQFSYTSQCSEIQSMFGGNDALFE